MSVNNDRNTNSVGGSLTNPDEVKNKKKLNKFEEFVKNIIDPFKTEKTEKEIGKYFSSKEPGKIEKRSSSLYKLIQNRNLERRNSEKSETEIKLDIKESLKSPQPKEDNSIDTITIVEDHENFSDEE